MGRRGEELREHILYVAKDVFLEMGFERASMDVIANRAETSKRTLYAHFENKEKLYLAVIDLVCQLFLKKLKWPGDYSPDAVEALVLFCGRFLEVLLFDRTIQMCRLAIAEATRFPNGSARYFEVMFSISHERLSVYLTEMFGLSAQSSSEAAQELLGQVIYPHFLRALFGIDALSEELDDVVMHADFNLDPIRKVVTKRIERFQREKRDDSSPSHPGTNGQKRTLADCSSSPISGGERNSDVE